MPTSALFYWVRFTGVDGGAAPGGADRRGAVPDVPPNAYRGDGSAAGHSGGGGGAVTWQKTRHTSVLCDPTEGIRRDCCDFDMM
jgi:hypothetical protein